MILVAGSQLLTPIPLNDVFVDPESVVDQVVERAPYWNQARYIPTGRAGAATTPRGHPLARTDGTAPPVFRADWAYGVPLVDDIDELFNHPTLLAAARDLFGGQHAVPYVLHVNLTAPGPAIDAGHIDVPAFRGLDRRDAPGWLLLAMARSGHFDSWHLQTATAVAWLYRGAGGEFTFWPDGPDRPSNRHGNLWNTALVGNNDRMFHRVESVGPPTAPDLALSADSVLTHIGERHFEIVDADRVVAQLPVDELRISVSWKAMVFADDDDLRRFESHQDDIDLESVRRRFVEELRTLGFEVALTAALDDAALIEAVAAAYPRSSPSDDTD